MVSAETLQARYPTLAHGFLETAQLAPLGGDLVLKAGKITITQAELDAIIQRYEPDSRRHAQDNSITILEKEIYRRLLVSEAVKEGFAPENGDDARLISTLIQKKKNEAVVTDAEARAFYNAHRTVYAEKSFDAAKNDIRNYLQKEARLQAKKDFFEAVCSRARIQVDERWMRTKGAAALGNPLDKARLSGKPTLADFGSLGCHACDMMQPVIEAVQYRYDGKLTTAFINVRENPILATRYEIHSVPVQVFYDANGNEVFRHSGVYSEKEITDQLSAMGITD